MPPSSFGISTRSSPRWRSVFARSPTTRPPPGRSAARPASCRDASATSARSTRCSRSASAPRSARRPRSRVDFDLTSEQQAIRKLAKDFAYKEIAPGARERDRGEIFPKDVLRKMAPLGLLGGPVPEKYGGIGLDYVSHALVTEEVGRADSSVRTTLSVQVSLVEMTILRFGTEEQKQRWLPLLCKGEVIGCFGLTEPEVGSDATKIRTSAKRDGDSWVLRGRKMWISNGSVSKLALIFAQGDPAKESKGITAFVLERDRQPYGSQALHGKLGLRSSDSSELILDDVRVPDANRLGEVGEGFKVAMSALDLGRYSVAAGARGGAPHLSLPPVPHAPLPQTFGKTIAGHPLVSGLVAGKG